MSGYIGTIPVPQATMNRDVLTATAGQTSFPTSGYTPGFLDVYMNGVHLVNGTDYTASNGSDVVLTTGAAADDIIEVVAFHTFTVADQIFTGDITFTGASYDAVWDASDNALEFGDNAKATFGAGSDLSIFHDGTHTYIDETNPTGYLFIRGANTQLLNPSNEIYLECNNDGSVDLYHDNSKKLATTSTGIDVTGTVTADGLTVDTDTLHVDATNNRVGIGTSSPSHLIDGRLSGTSSGEVISVGNVTNGSFGGIAISDGGTYPVRHWGSSLEFYTGNSTYSSSTERMRIDSSGNLQLTSVDQAIEFNATTTAHESRLKWNYGGTLQSWIEREHSDGSMVFGNQGTERMRIDSGGSLLLGTTTNLGSNAKMSLRFAGGGTQYGLEFKPDADTTTPVSFRNSAGSVIGSISTTSSATSYNTSSDYRLKENVTDVTDGIARVKQLEPKRFNFIADPDKTVDGFLAHEAQAVVPEAVTGTHNEVDDDGNAVMQGIDQSKLVPLLTAALKEAITKIETLETEMASVKARLDALEGNK